MIEYLVADCILVPTALLSQSKNVPVNALVLKHEATSSFNSIKLTYGVSVTYVLYNII